MPKTSSALIPRRSLLQAGPTTLVTLVALAAAGCKKGEPASCTSTLGLMPDEIKVRTSLGYADRSPDPAKHCVLCQQFVPAPEASDCGTCKIMKGPIHPQGSCNAYTPKP